jgi:hypothetical protein
LHRIETNIGADINYGCPLVDFLSEIKWYRATRAVEFPNVRVLLEDFFIVLIIVASVSNATNSVPQDVLPLPEKTLLISYRC